MTNEVSSTVDLVWDLTQERLTLGGALVLRQEGEMLARIKGCKLLVVHLACKERDRRAAERLGQAIFGSSIYPFQLTYSKQNTYVWPSASVRSQTDFSYFSFSRVTELYAESGLCPRLQWSKEQLALAQQIRSTFPGRLISIHLRSIPPFLPEDSCADGYAWNEFLAEHAEPDVCDFLLIGDDPLPEGLEIRPGVSQTTRLKMDIATQLTLIGLSDGFLGMASGVCTAANFSGTPYVIFKHPAHHTAEMTRELGASNTFLFASDRQQLWRQEADAPSLKKAIKLISL